MARWDRGLNNYQTHNFFSQVDDVCINQPGHQKTKSHILLELSIGFVVQGDDIRENYK